MCAECLPRDRERRVKRERQTDRTKDGGTSIEGKEKDVGGCWCIEMHCLQAVVGPYGPRLPIPGIRSSSKWERAFSLSLSLSLLSVSFSRVPSAIRSTWRSRVCRLYCGRLRATDNARLHYDHKVASLTERIRVKLYRQDGDALPRASDAVRGVGP